MVSDLWINLPVKDVAKSKDFYTKLGFELNTQYGNGENSASFIIGEKRIILMLFNYSSFTDFIAGNIANPHNGTEVLLSVGLNSKDEVDDLANKAISAGGKSNHKSAEMKGWMYGCLFEDLDGHKWNGLYMDITKMPKGV